ncbi:MAG: hypothetical protein IJ009_05065 [Clostridia bacterium]|nr:hypothetical protein [Clostridia bacterium]
MKQTERHKYKPWMFCLIAILGEAPVAFLVVHLLCGFLVEEHTLLFSLAVTPFLLAIGVLLQILFIKKDIRESHEEHFYPSPRIYLPRRVPFLSYCLSITAGILLSLPFSAFYTRISDQYDPTVGAVLLSLSFVIAVIWGQTLAAMRAQALAGVQHMIEVGAFYIVYAVLLPRESVLLECLFVLSILVCIISYVFRLNQLGLAKLQSTADTVHVGGRMLAHSLLSALLLMLLSTLLFVVLLAVATVLYVLGQALLWLLFAGIGASSSPDAVFLVLFVTFPTEIPFINLTLFFLGLVAIPFGVVLLLARKNSALRRALEKFFLRVSVWFSRRVQESKAQSAPKTEAQREYTDYIQPVARAKEAFIYPSNYQAVCRQLKKLPSERKQISYAYRVMTDCLIRANMGIQVTHTPQEIAAILIKKNVMQDGRELSRAFEIAAYAPDGAQVPDAARVLSRILQIVRMYL